MITLTHAFIEIFHGLWASFSNVSVITTEGRNRISIARVGPTRRCAVKRCGRSSEWLCANSPRSDSREPVCDQSKRANARWFRSASPVPAL